MEKKPQTPDERFAALIAMHNEYYTTLTPEQVEYARSLFDKYHANMQIGMDFSFFSAYVIDLSDVKG